MPVDFDGSADYIKFADNAIYDDLTTKSIFLRTTPEGDGSENVNRLLSKLPAAASTGWSFGHDTVSDRFDFTQTSNDGAPVLGRWATTNSTVTNGTTYSLGGSMDIGNINNDPILYLEGAADTNEITASAGAFTTDAGDGLHAGYLAGSSDNSFFEGKIWDIHIANVIWTPAEFASLHASNAPGLWMRGLIFYAPMNGAAGLQTFGEAALGGANTVTDIISGIIGTAASSPLGVSDTTLAF